MIKVSAAQETTEGHRDMVTLWFSVSPLWLSVVKKHLWLKKSLFDKEFGNGKNSVCNRRTGRG